MPCALPVGSIAVDFTYDPLTCSGLMNIRTYVELSIQPVMIIPFQWQIAMMVFIHCTGGPDITLAGHDGESRRAADAQVTLTEPVPAVSVHFMYVLYSHSTIMWRVNWICQFWWLSALFPTVLCLPGTTYAALSAVVVPAVTAALQQGEYSSSVDRGLLKAATYVDSLA